MRIKRATFRHIEAEIAEYQNTLKYMEEVRRDIIESTAPREPGMPVSESGTSSTESRGTRLADSILLKEMKRITEAIAETWARSSDDRKRVVWVKYGFALPGWQPPKELQTAMLNRARWVMTVDEIAEVLSMGSSTYGRHRMGFVYEVARRLGWY